MIRGIVLCVTLALTACGDDGGASADAAPTADGDYAAYNLFTGAPRFALFKADAERDVCVRVVFLWADGEATVDLADSFADESVTITHQAADCAGDGGGPPSLEPEGIPADSTTGTATVSHDTGLDRWTVSIDVTLTFAPAESWVPETEPVLADDLEIVGGCC